MAGIIKTSINLSAIPKDKIIAGKKGKYSRSSYCRSNKRRA